MTSRHVVTKGDISFNLRYFRSLKSVRRQTEILDFHNSMYRKSKVYYLQVPQPVRMFLTNLGWNLVPLVLNQAMKTINLHTQMLQKLIELDILEETIYIIYVILKNMTDLTICKRQDFIRQNFQMTKFREYILLIFFFVKNMLYRFSVKFFV